MISDTLSKPAIINQNSNTKKGGRSYLSRISPNKIDLNTNVTPVNEEENQKLSEQYLQDNPDYSSINIINDNRHQHNPSSASGALKTTVNYGLSITNPTSLMQYGTFLNEMEGLDLTDENVNENFLVEESEMNDVGENDDQEIDLNTMNEAIKDSYINGKNISNISNIKNEQQDALKDLEVVEAELQAEVNQLDIMYEQHI
jgi:hypothetical protein